MLLSPTGTYKLIMNIFSADKLFRLFYASFEKYERMRNIIGLISLRKKEILAKDYLNERKCDFFRFLKSYQHDMSYPNRFFFSSVYSVFFFSLFFSSNIHLHFTSFFGIQAQFVISLIKYQAKEATRSEIVNEKIRNQIGLVLLLQRYWMNRSLLFFIFCCCFLFRWE